MDPPFPARFPFEMLDRVGDVNLVAIDSRLRQRAIEDFSGRPDKRFARDIFEIARLLAHQHDRRAFWSFAKDGLGRTFVKMTSRAIARRFARLC